MNAHLESILERPVDEVHVAIAKHELQGIELAMMAEIFACDECELQDIMALPEYKEVKQLIALELAQYSADTDISWDALEYKALQKLNKTAELIQDPEFHLKVAAVANKAVRRHRNGGVEVLNPAAVGARVNLTLTQRFVEKLTDHNGAAKEVTQERRVDIEQAAQHRPSAKEITSFLLPTAHKKDSLSDMLQSFDSLALA